MSEERTESTAVVRRSDLEERIRRLQQPSLSEEAPPGEFYRSERGVSPELRGSLCKHRPLESERERREGARERLSVPERTTADQSPLAPREELEERISPRRAVCWRERIDR